MNTMPASFRPVLSQWLTQERPSDGATPLLLVWRNQLGAKNSSMLPRSSELQLCTKSAVIQAPELLLQGGEGGQVLDLIRCFVEHDRSGIVTPEPWPKFIAKLEQVAMQQQTAPAAAAAPSRLRLQSGCATMRPRGGRV